MVEGVLPTNAPSISMSAPRGEESTRNDAIDGTGDLEDLEDGCRAAESSRDEFPDLVAADASSVVRLDAAFPGTVDLATKTDFGVTTFPAIVTVSAGADGGATLRFEGRVSPDV